MLTLYMLLQSLIIIGLHLLCVIIIWVILFVVEYSCSLVLHLLLRPCTLIHLFSFSSVLLDLCKGGC